jgi:preprotein translocase subunit SecG
MDILQTLVVVLHIIAALVIIGLVLLQHGKGADMGASFGSGSAGSLFGATGSANFLSRTTAVIATIFFLTSLGMAFLATHKPRTGGGAGVMEGVTVPANKPATPSAPAIPGQAPSSSSAPSPAAIPGQQPGKAASPAAPAGSGAAAPAPAAPAAPASGGATGEPAKINQIPK